MSWKTIWACADNGKIQGGNGTDIQPCIGDDLTCTVINPVIQLDYDFRNFSRVNKTALGMVAADSSRCSQIGLNVLQVIFLQLLESASQGLTYINEQCR